MRVDTGVQSEDTFWFTPLNIKGDPITTGGGPFEIEMYSPTSPEMMALRNKQLDDGEVNRIRVRQEIRRQGLEGEAAEARIYEFLKESLTDTSSELIRRAIKSWKNFPRLLDATGKPLNPEPSAPDWPPACTPENVDNFLRENPNLFLQIKRAYENAKNWLRESVSSLSETSSNTPNDNASSISPSPSTESPSEPISKPLIH